MEKKLAADLLHEFRRLVVLFARIEMLSPGRGRNSKLPRLTAQQYCVLGWASKGISQKEIARRIGLPPRTVSNVIKPLISANYVDSKPIPRCRRKHMVQLTDKGLDLLQKIEEDSAFAVESGLPQLIRKPRGLETHVLALRNVADSLWKTLNAAPTSTPPECVALSECPNSETKSDLTPF